MRDDARRMRGELPTLLVSLREDPLATPIADWVRSLVAARVAA